ncbi:MAG: SGNH/GDSL hydrolase family protein [Lachnospiraceae bacterium]|nr:SGNH/GDSL hydrolase family protein [Lachnospiraceae bacterium]
MAGPVAPKDPVKKRPAIYLMYDKQIFANPGRDGEGVCFLFMDDGRMPAMAKMVGGVDDFEILKMLGPIEDFKKLVYGIGVSMINEKGVDGEFVLQIYGKNDTYNGGTSLKARLTSDGTEYLIPLNEVEWKEDDDRIGQIRFHFDKAEFPATVMVKLYLNDGYTAPEFVPSDPVDINSDRYKELIAQSLVSMGNIERLTKAINKAKRGESVKMAFIGGSITQGAGATPINAECYAYKTYKAFDEMFSSSHNTEYVKAGVGGTPSEFGIVRFDRDILRGGYFLKEGAGEGIDPDREPDIAVVEFAVNDEGDETKGKCFEGLIRRFLMMKNMPAVIIIFSVFIDDYNLQERLSPIGFHYDIPMVSAKNAVTAQFYTSKEQGRIITKDQYFYDRYHPTNLGHTIMADCIINLLKKADEAATAMEKASSLKTGKMTETLLKPLSKALEKYKMPENALMSDHFEYVSLLTIGKDSKDIPGGKYLESCINGDDGFGNTWKVNAFDLGDFSEKDPASQYAERDFDLFGTMQYSDNRRHISGNKPLTLDAECRLLMIVTLDSAAPDEGKADIFVDDKLVRTVDPKEIGWTHCNALIIFDNDEKARHNVKIAMHEGDEDKKFTILAFGIR